MVGNKVQICSWTLDILITAVRTCSPTCSLSSGYSHNYGGPEGSKHRTKATLCYTKRKRVLSFSIHLISFSLFSSRCLVRVLDHASLYFCIICSFVFHFAQSRSCLMSCSWPLERGRLPATVRSWKRSSSTTRRSVALLITDIFPRASSTRPKSWGSWRRLVVGSMCIFSPRQH